MIGLSRRRFLVGATALFCAPAIVRASSLMPVRVPWYGRSFLGVMGPEGLSFISHDSDLFAAMARASNNRAVSDDFHYVASPDIRHAMEVRAAYDGNMLLKAGPSFDYQTMFRGRFIRTYQI